MSDNRVGILSNSEVERLYDKNAGSYDLLLAGFRWAGLNRWRRNLIARLELKPGDCVVDLCAGTGANLPFLLNQVGSHGRVILVDLSQGMLEKGRARATQLGAGNVDFIKSDAGAFAFPQDIQGVVSTFGLEMPPDYAEIIAKAVSALPRGGRLALLGLKHPESWPRWLIDIGILLTKSFGVSREYEEFQPWIPAREHLREVHFREFLFGCAYEFVGEKA